MLEQLAGDDDVEARVGELERLLDVGPVGLDPELRGLGERLAVDVDPDYVVPLDVRLRERAVPAPEVEDVAARASDELREERGAHVGRVDELARATRAVVFPVALLEPVDGGESMRG